MSSYLLPVDLTLLISSGELASLPGTPVVPLHRLFSTNIAALHQQPFLSPPCDGSTALTGFNTSYNNYTGGSDTAAPRAAIFTSTT